MGLALRDNRHSNDQRRGEGERLKELKEAAAEIRRKHEAGAMTSREAARELAKLKNRYRRSLLDFFL